MAFLNVDMDAFDIGVFKVTVSIEEASDWLIDPSADLIEVDGAIDEATSFAADHGEAFIIIRVK